MLGKHTGESLATEDVVSNLRHKRTQAPGNSQRRLQGREESVDPAKEALHVKNASWEERKRQCGSAAAPSREARAYNGTGAGGMNTAQEGWRPRWGVQWSQDDPFKTV